MIIGASSQAVHDHTLNSILLREILFWEWFWKALKWEDGTGWQRIILDGQCKLTSKLFRTFQEYFPPKENELSSKRDMFCTGPNLFRIWLRGFDSSSGWYSCFVCKTLEDQNPLFTISFEFSEWFFKTGDRLSALIWLFRYAHLLSWREWIIMFFLGGHHKIMLSPV